MLEFITPTPKELVESAKTIYNSSREDKEYIYLLLQKNLEIANNGEPPEVTGTITGILIGMQIMKNRFEAKKSNTSPSFSPEFSTDRSF